jgi:DNA invertase Pin-like site-specific DNA recombinase
VAACDHRDGPVRYLNFQQARDSPGRGIPQPYAAFAELERDIIHERTMAGLKAARAQGKAGGRPTVMDPGKLAAARARRDRGESPTQIARALGVSRASVYRHLAGAESQEG